jgi:hypothetical protein
MHIIHVIREMIGVANENNVTVMKKINGVTILVNGDSNADLILRDQQRAQSGYIKKRVGPYPKAKLTPADKANDRCIESKRKRRMRKK